MSTGRDLWPSGPWLPTGQGEAPRVRTPSPGGGQGRVRRLDVSATDVAQVHRYVARRVANAADAEDIAQQTLLHACAKLHTCRGENHRAWLFTIARHQIVDHYRAQSRVRFVEAAALAETEPALQTRPDAVLTAFEGRERLACMARCVTRRLRLEEQVAVLLADVHGRRDRDSAAALHMSVPSFKLLLHGARARLQAIAGGNCMLVRKTSAAACDERVNADGSQGAGHGGDGTPTQGLGVICRLGAAKLLALRAELQEGLKP